MPDYPATTGVDLALDQYPNRAVTYMSGESDVCDQPFMIASSCEAGVCVPEDGGLDTSCSGYARGWCRMARFHAFAQYVNIFYTGRGVDLGDRHQLLSVPGVGHSGCGMFQSPAFASAALLV